MESEIELQKEVASLRARVEVLGSLVQDLAHSIRSTQEPMTVTKFADRVGISVGKLRKMIKAGEVKKKGMRISPTELAKFGM